MAPVAPEPPTMSKDPAPLKPQPKIPDNGCCMHCCGAATPSIDVNDILRDGGKYVQHEDGRIVEYFLYGSDAPDAKAVMLQINGSMGTGYMPANLSLVDKKLKELNLRGISITIPGQGYTSMFPATWYHLGDWPRLDVVPVLKAEGLADKPLWVEGSSYGAGLALGVFSHFGKQVERIHLHVPYIPWELRKELGLPEAIGDDAFLDKDTAWANSCGSCYLHCCCSCMFNCCGSSAFDDEHTKVAEEKAPGSTAVTHKDISRASRRGTNSFGGADGAKLTPPSVSRHLMPCKYCKARPVSSSDQLTAIPFIQILIEPWWSRELACVPLRYGLVHNVVGSVISKNWGFDLREIDCGSTKVMVSYNHNDTQARRRPRRRESTDTDSNPASKSTAFSITAAFKQPRRKQAPSFTKKKAFNKKGILKAILKKVNRF